MPTRHESRSRRVVLTVLAIASACSSPAGPPPFGLDAETAAAVAHAAAEPTGATRIKADLFWLAADARQGRGTGTAAYDQAARYVAARFQGLGLKPGGDQGGWFQQVPMRKSKNDVDAFYLSIASKGSAPIGLNELDDYLILRPQAPTVEASAPAVFVGHGITDESSGVDDYAGLDVKGKIVVVMGGAPASFDIDKAAYYRVFTADAKRRIAADHGAIGMILVPTEFTDRQFPWELQRAEFVGNAQMTWRHSDGTPESPAPAIAVLASMSAPGARKLFAGAPESYDELRRQEAAGTTRLPSFEMPVVVSLKGGAIVEDLSSPNVVGVLEGGDPTLKAEFVVMTAHLDHIGMGEVDPRHPDADVIYNGADDNASGVAVLIEEVRKFRDAGVRPARSVIFLATTGEEANMIGADFFARYPTVPKENMVADVNLDGAIPSYHFIDVIAFGAEHSTLESTVRKAAASMDLPLLPDPVPEMRAFTRSDQYRFVQQGIPSVFLVAGRSDGKRPEAKPRYHQVDDDVTQPFDYEEGDRFARLNWLVARDLANAAERPRWNKGDFFGERYGKRPRQ